MGTGFDICGSLILVLTDAFYSNMAPNGIEMSWEVILDAMRFILAKYELVARYGNLFCNTFSATIWAGDGSLTEMVPMRCHVIKHKFAVLLPRLRAGGESEN